MVLFRRTRFLFLVVQQLGAKYPRALVFGFFLGFFATLGIGRVLPFVRARFLAPVARIGVVGESPPPNLPLFIQKEISSGLTTLAPDGAATSGLAQHWEATDSGKTYTFFLREDVFWQNNKPVTAADVNYNIQNVTFAVINPHTLKATLPCTTDPCSFSPFP